MLFLHFKQAELTGRVCRGSADVYQRQRVNNTADRPMMLFTDQREAEREALNQHLSQVEKSWFTAQLEIGVNEF